MDLYYIYTCLIAGVSFVTVSLRRSINVCTLSSLLLLLLLLLNPGILKNFNGIFNDIITNKNNDMIIRVINNNYIYDYTNLMVIILVIILALSSFFFL